MKVHLPYGRQGLEVTLPDQAQVLLPKRVPAVARPEEAVNGVDDDGDSLLDEGRRRWATVTRTARSSSGT